MRPADLELLVTRQMPFGKHKGCLIADLPGNYLNWFAREGFPPGELGRLLALMQEMDHNGLRPFGLPEFFMPMISGMMSFQPKGRAMVEITSMTYLSAVPYGRVYGN